MSQAGIANTNAIPPPPGVVETLTGDTGGKVFPDASNNINVKGGWTIQTDGNLSANTLNVDPSKHGYPNTPYVVGPPYFGGQIKSGYQTLASALADLNGIFGEFTLTTQSGLYIENLNFTRTGFDQNVDIIGDVVDSRSPAISAVGIQGNHTIPTGGITVKFGNVLLLTPVGNTLTTSGSPSLTSQISLRNTNFSVSNGYVCNFQNWQGALSVDNCGLNSSSTQDGFIDNTGGSANVIINNSFLGAGNSNSMNLFGNTVIYNSQIYCPVNFGTGCVVECENVQFFNTVTISGNATATFRNCTFIGGTSAAINMSSTGNVFIYHASVDSTNNPAISGAGTGVIKYEDIIFVNNASFAGTLTTATTSWQPYSVAIAASDGTKVGTAAFNSAQFTVDTNGFVSANGSGLGRTITGNDGVVLSPTLGNWNIVGKGVASSGQSAAGNIFTTGAGSTLTINMTDAQFMTSYSSVNHAASPYTVLFTDYYISCDPSGGTITIDLPNASTTNRLFIVKDRTGNASTNNISITTPGGAVTIDGQTTYKITSNFGAVNLLFNGTSYEVF